nr:immunoglobulin heavy chain junction region [Homo sapiens]
VTAADTAVYYC